MATPEQNMLLAMQLFQRPADQYREDSSMLNNVMLRLAQAKQEEQLRRDLATQQATREDARWKAQGEREDARIAASDKRQTETIAAAERRQREAQTEKERLDIENEIDRVYRLYAGAAERAGVTPNKRETYATTRAGLGQLQADAASAEFAVQKRQDQLSATAMLSELDSAQAQLSEIEKRRQEFAKPSASDQKIARSTAVQALQEKLDDFPSLQKRPNAINPGLAALRRGDSKEAEDLLGRDVVLAFESTYAQALEQLPGTRVRMQQSAQLQQTEQQARANLDKYRSLLAQAASKNPTLAEGFAKSQSGIRALMTTEPAPRATIEDVVRRQFGDAPAPAAAPKASPSPSFKVPNVNSLQYGSPASAGMVGFQGASTPPSLSNRMNAAPAAAAPAPIIAVPPREPAPIIRIPPPEPAPIIQLPPEAGGAAGYPAFRDSLGGSAVNQLIRRPVTAEFARTQNLYGDKQVDPEYVRRLQMQRLTELLHGGQFNSPDERALARSQIYELLGVSPVR